MLFFGLSESKRKKRYSGGADSFLGKKLRKRFNENNRCSYCGIETTLHRGENGLTTLTSATLDHIYSVRDLRRFCWGGAAVVLSCRGCNERKAREEYNQIFIPYHEENNYSIWLIGIIKTQLI